MKEDRLQTAHKAFKHFQERTNVLRNMRVIANQSMPEKKQKRIDAATTKALVEKRNADSAFKAAYKKLTYHEKLQLQSDMSLPKVGGA